MKFSSILILTVSFVIYTCGTSTGDGEETTVEGCTTNDNSTSSMQEFSHIDQTFSHTFQTFSDKACANKAMTTTSAGSFTVGSGGVLSTGSVTVKFTLHTAELVSAFNSAEFCGYSDWALDSIKDVTGRTCSASSSTSTSTATSTLMGFELTY